MIKEYVEVESGKRTDRPQLEAALQACRLHGAKLVIARLDRLSRDAHFLLGLDKAGVDFVAADMPHANRLTVGVMALVAEEERKHISANTKAALERFPLDLNRKGYRGFPRACKSDSVPPTTTAGVGDGEGLLERPAGAGRLDRRGG